MNRIHCRTAGREFRAGIGLKWVCSLLLFMALAVCSRAESLESCMEKGKAACGKGQYKEAESFFTAAIQIDPSHSSAYTWRGLTREKQKNYEGSIADYTMSLKLKPDNPQTLFDRAILLVDVKNYAGAEKDCRRFLEIGKPEGKVYEVRVYGLLGNCREKQGDFTSARAFYEKALKLDPKFEYAQKGLARLKTKEGEGGTGTPSSANPQESRSLRLLGAVGDFRTRAALSLDNALSSVHGAGKMDFITKSASYRSTPYAWAYFFSETFVLLGNPAEMEPVVAFYNPYLDAVLMTRWQIKPMERTQAITDAFFCYGADFVAGKKGAAGIGPRWASDSTDVGSALSRQYQSFVSAFDGRFSAKVSNHAAFDGLKKAVAGTTSSNMETMAVLQVSLLRGLHVPDDRVADEISAVRAALAGGNKALLRKVVPDGNPLTAEDLADLPEEFRQRLTPVFVIPGDESVIVLLASQAGPKFGALLNCRTKPEIAVSGIGIYNFGAAEVKR